jgi:hypothetical protein
LQSKEYAGKNKNKKTRIMIKLDVIKSSSMIKGITVPQESTLV